MKLFYGPEVCCVCWHDRDDHDGFDEPPEAGWAGPVECPDCDPCLAARSVT